MVTLLLFGSAPAFADFKPCTTTDDTVQTVLAHLGIDDDALDAGDDSEDDENKKKKKKRVRAGAPDGPTAGDTDPNADGRPAIADTIQEMQATGAPILSPEPVPMWGGGR